MAQELMCFFITPIGQPDTPIRRNADAAYRLLSEAADAQGWKHERGDERCNSDTISEDVRRAIREADLCVVDISEYNVNVYYELGYAEGLGKTITLLLRADVTEDVLPADFRGRKRISYAIGDDGVAACTNPGELHAALSQIRKEIESGPQPLPAIYDPVATLQECCARGDIANADICLEVIRRTQTQLLYTEMCIVAASAGSMQAAEALLNCAPDYIRREGVDLEARLQCLCSVVAAMQNRDLARRYHQVAEGIAARLAEEMRSSSLSLQAEAYAQKAMIHYCAYAATHDQAHLDQAVQAMTRHVLPYRAQCLNDEMNMAVFLNEYQDMAHLRQGLRHALQAIRLITAAPGDHQEDLLDALTIACILSSRMGDGSAHDLLLQLRALRPDLADRLMQKYTPSC